MKLVLGPGDRDDLSGPWHPLVDLTWIIQPPDDKASISGRSEASGARRMSTVVRRWPGFDSQLMEGAVSSTGRAQHWQC